MLTFKGEMAMRIIASLILLGIILILFSVKSVKAKFTRSSKRAAPIDLVLKNNVHLSSCGAVFVYSNKVDFFTSSFKIKSNDLVIYIDPMLVDLPEKADYIFITHCHKEHFTTEDIDLLMGENTKIVCPEYVADKLIGYPVIAVGPMDEKRFGDFKFSVRPSSNDKNKKEGICESQGYILEVDENKIYHAGENGIDGSIIKGDKITLALVPIDGDEVMDSLETIRIVNEIRPNVVVPMHYDLRQNSLDIFQKGIAEDIDFHVLDKID